MAFSWFLKLAFKCLDHFAWPLLALGYPLLASVQAIETDSHTETRDLISYWILLSLIYLFEYAFTRLLQWFQFWPYIKLMIIFWLIIPDFGRASYVYNNLIRSCIFMKPKTVICRLNNYWRQFFVEKDNFLLHAETYMKENGTEALEKLIASKNTMYKPNAEATNAIRAADNKEMQQTNDKRLQTEHKDIKDLEVIEKKENPAGNQNTMYKPKAEATNAIRATDNKEMQQNTMYKPKAEATNAIRATDNKEMQQNTMYKPKAEATNAIRATDNKEMQQNAIYKPKAEAANAIRATDDKEMQQNAMYKPKAEATNAIRATDDKEMQQNAMYKPKAEATNAIRATDDKEMQQNTMYKPKAEATNAIRATDNKEMQQTNDKRLQTEHKDIKDLEVIEKNEIPAGKQWMMKPCGKQMVANDIPAMPNLAPSQKASSAIVETKGIEGKYTAGGELPRPQSSTHKEVQKEWTCALCQITASSEKNLNSHLLGMKHRAACEALKAKNQHTPQKPKICQSKEEMKQKNVINQPNSNAKNRETIANNGLKKKVVMDHKVQEPKRNLSEPVRRDNSKLKCEVCNVRLREVDMVSHLKGRKHLAKINK